MSLRKMTLPSAGLAILLMIGSTACFSLMNIFIRYAAVDMHTTVIVFLRNLFSVVLLLPWVLRQGSQVLVTDRMFSHFWRGTVGIIGMQLWFYCVDTLPLNEATALSFTAPILTTIFAIIFLGEKAGWHRWLAVIIGFIGALIIIRPDPYHMNWELLIVPCATSMWAIASIFVKTLTRTEPPNRIVFYMAFFMTLWSAIPAFYYWQTPDLYHLILAFGVALASTIAHLLMVRSFARADIALLMPFDFFRLVFTAIFAYFAFDEVADGMTWIGGTVIIGSAAYIAYREARIKRKIVLPQEPVT